MSRRSAPRLASVVTALVAIAHAGCAGTSSGAGGNGGNTSATLDGGNGAQTGSGGNTGGSASSSGIGGKGTAGNGNGGNAGGSTSSSGAGGNGTAGHGAGGSGAGGNGSGAGGNGSGGGPACANLSGTIHQLAKGTYCVTGDVIIPAGTTLTVPPGTELVFMGRFHFGRDPALPDMVGAVSGGLTAIGTAAEPIVFRGETPQTGWFGIAISFSPDPVHLEHVTIRDTYKDDHDPNSRIWRRGGALSSYVNEKGTIIRHGKFINNRAWMVAGALDINSNGVWPNLGPVEITHTLFEGNSCECGIYVGSPDDKCGGGAIRFSHIGGPVTIDDNVFHDNHALGASGIDAYGGAIGAFSSLLPLGKNNVFDENGAQKADGAISCAGHPELGVNFISVGPGNTFTNNVPDIGCGL
jgi:hypothetical protein